MAEDIADIYHTTNGSISLFHFDISGKFTECLESRLIALLNKDDQEFLGSLKNEHARHRSLAGRLMIRYIARLLELDPVHHVVRSETGRPELLQQGMDMGISHAGNMVVCAFVHGARIGLDIECIRDRPVQHVRRYFTASERRFIDEHENSNQAFYQIWTRKEAVIKADGRGLAIALDSFDCLGDQCIIDSSIWHLQEVALVQGYVCHIACIRRMPLQTIDFNPVFIREYSRKYSGEHTSKNADFQ
jgi:4'-phosphopantetheinyl transferase